MLVLAGPVSRVVEEKTKDDSVEQARKESGMDGNITEENRIRPGHQVCKFVVCRVCVICTEYLRTSISGGNDDLNATLVLCHFCAV